MKLSRSYWRTGLGVLAICGMAAVLSGCIALQDEPVFSEAPPVSATAAPAADGTSAAAPGDQISDRYRVGDLVTVKFSGVQELIPPHEERIKEDGSITLHLIGSVIATGKNSGELQQEIQARYQKYYRGLVVTVVSLDRFFYVGGEVKSPGRQPWVGALTVTQAIQVAGDFTDFANKKKVQLTRADGSTLTVNCVKALKDPKLDPRVMPGDKVSVPRRWW
jgi:polysaccharide export outer membrane protein